jgi:malonate-semialdehyde dehydrogenase (acetylating)/methylmalonate-semialdehyde dehydrogenase
MQVNSLDEAIQLVNSNKHGNGTAIFTNSGPAARKFQTEIEVGQGGELQNFQQEAFYR